MKYIALKSVDNDILINGDSCCVNLQELYTALVDPTTTEIEIRKDFANEFFTYQSLCDFIDNTRALFPNISVHVENTVYDTAMDAVNEILSYKHPDEFVYAVEKDPTRVISTIQFLGKYFREAKEDAAVANNKLSTMLVQIEDLQKQLGYASIDYDKLLARNNDLESKLHALVSRVNYRYEKTVNPDEMFMAYHNSYNHILYLKEITRVHYTDTLVYYLSEILKTLYSVPVRVVAIEPFYAYDSARLYPDFKPHWNLTYQDVYAGNVLMAGYQPKIMTDILKNPNHVNYLIVLDRGGYGVPHIQCDNVTNIFLASDEKDLPGYADPEHSITYTERTMQIPYIPDFDTLSLEERIKKYSSMTVMKKLIDYLEEA